MLSSFDLTSRYKFHCKLLFMFLCIRHMRFPIFNFDHKSVQVYDDYLVEKNRITRKCVSNFQEKSIGIPILCNIIDIKLLRTACVLFIRCSLVPVSVVFFKFFCIQGSCTFNIFVLLADHVLSFTT
jgi:hypothetical protein